VPSKGLLLERSPRNYYCAIKMPPISEVLPEVELLYCAVKRPPVGKVLQKGGASPWRPKGLLLERSFRKVELLVCRPKTSC
jgi:hypothetical protein